MAPSILACTVRNCGLPLERGERTFACPRGHAYDIARVGYVNLLQPQDRRSREAGDARAAVEARARLLAAGIGRGVLDAVVERAASLDLAGDAVVDLGSGSGEMLGTLADVMPIAGIGIDLSTAAAAHAARRFPDLTWAVANADRRLPLLDERVDLLLSVHARRNPAECARVLRPGGALLVAVPAADDLIELRAAVQGEGLERTRADAVLAEHQPFFRPVDRFVVRDRHRLERDRLVELLRGTYRGSRTSAVGRIESLDTLDVTLASDVLLLARC